MSLSSNGVRSCSAAALPLTSEGAGDADTSVAGVVSLLVDAAGLADAVAVDGLAAEVDAIVVGWRAHSLTPFCAQA